MEFDLEELAAIVELLKDADFTEFRLQKGDLSLLVTRGPAGPAVVSAPTSAPATPSQVTAAQPVVAPEPTPAPRATKPAPVVPAASPDALEPDEVLVTAPMLGTFYRSPKPGEPQFVAVGDKVEPGTVIGIVEVMKLMTSITAAHAGEVTKIFAADGQLVEAGQPLCAIRTTE